MNRRHRAIRAQLSEMCRDRRIDTIKAFHLSPDEELFIMEREVNGKSIAKIARENHTSIETITRHRHDAFQKMCDAMDYAKEKHSQ